jgi:hypothetical protein
MAQIVVPEGKKIKFYKTQNKTDITSQIVSNVDLVLDNEVSLNFNSTFSPLVDEDQNSLVTIFQQVSQSFFGKSLGTQFKQFGFQIWKKTDPLTFTINFTLSMKRDAYEDVVKSSKELIKLTLPKIDKGSFGLVPPGPSILTALDDVKIKQANYERIDVSIGKMFFSNIIVKKVQPTYSIETDDYGYPIWCKIQMDLATVFTATNETVDNMFQVI